MTKCKKCYHPCHCKDGIHADEYGMCVCDNCKCGSKRTYEKQIEHATDMTYENESS